VSKEDRRAIAEHVLRPREALHARAGAGDAGSMRGGSGGGGVTWRGGNKPVRGRGATARVLGWHVAQLRAAWGRWVHGTWPARAAGRRREETEEPGLEEDDED
jgi:hypothetical protein